MNRNILWHWADRLALPLIFAFLFVLVIGLFPISSLFNAEPVNYNDYMLHYYHWNTFEAYMKDSSQPWGYNPYWMAGYPDNTIYDVENKGVELLTYLASAIGLNDVLAFKWYLMLTFLLGPFLTYWAARNFGFSRGSGLLILFLQIIFWYTTPFVRVMVVTGAFSYAFVSYLSIYILSLLYLYLKFQNPRTLVALALLSALAVLLHVYSTVIICIPGLILYALLGRRQPLRVHLALVGVAVFVLLVNLYWLIPLVRFIHYTTVTGGSLIQGSLMSFLIWSLMAVFMTPGLILVIGYAFPGFRLLRNELGKQLFVFFLGTILFFALVGAFGRYTPITRMLVALRYHVNVFQYLAFPGALGLIAGIKAMRNQFSQKRGRTILKSVGLGIVVLIPLLLVLGIADAPADTNPIAWFYSRKLDNSIYSYPQSAPLISWLKTNTTPDARILIESVWSPMTEEENAWYYMHYEPILPLLVNREFIGGPRADSLLVHHFSSFHLDFVEFEQLASAQDVPMFLFKKRIETISLEQLKEYFDLYNVRWVIAARPISKEYFDLFPEYVSRVETFGDVWIYEVKRQPSFLIGCQGQVEATYNHIYVKACSGDDVILKYHWMEGLRTNPQLQIEPVMMLDDPIGFIKIHNAPTEFEIFNGY